MVRSFLKWSGSKYRIVKMLAGEIPDHNLYIEPFLGSGVFSQLSTGNELVLNDILTPCYDVWKTVYSNPKGLMDSYKKHHDNIIEYGEEYYYTIRKQFNVFGKPEDFLFLTRTCVNGQIRFNSSGQFNVSYHHNRFGMKPTKLNKIISWWNNYLIYGKKCVKITNEHYVDVIFNNNIDSNTLIFIDPPYSRTAKAKLYGVSTFDINELFDTLKTLTAIGSKWIFTYDIDIPIDLYKRKIIMNDTLAPFQKVVDKKRKYNKEIIYFNY